VDFPRRLEVSVGPVWPAVHPVHPAPAVAVRPLPVRADERLSSEVVRPAAAQRALPLLRPVVVPTADEMQVVRFEAVLPRRQSMATKMEVSANQRLRNQQRQERRAARKPVPGEACFCRSLWMPLRFCRASNGASDGIPLAFPLERNGDNAI